MSENTPSDSSSPQDSGQESDQGSRYWRANIVILGSILIVWFLVSFGCGILFRDWVDVHFPKVGNAPFGFWMAQQGAIICFVLLLVLYSVLMNRLDRKSGYVSREQN